MLHLWDLIILLFNSQYNSAFNLFQIVLEIMPNTIKTNEIQIIKYNTYRMQPSRWGPASDGRPEWRHWSGRTFYLQLNVKPFKINKQI